MDERPDPKHLCQSCNRVPTMGKWVCQCGNILNLDVLRHDKPSDRLPGVTDQLVAQAKELTPTGKLGKQDQVTLKFDPVHGLSELFMGRVVPTRKPDVDVFARDLSPLELYLYSKIDGQRSAAELSALVGLKQVELGVLLLTLMRTDAVATVAKVSVTTVSGEGSMWGQVVTAQMRKAATDNAQQYYETFKKRRDTGDIDGATLHLKKAVAAMPAEEYIKALEEHLAKAVRQCDEVYRTARGALTQGKPEEAVTALEKAIVKFPREAGFYNLLAIAIMASTKSTSRAVAYLQRACEIDPFNAAYAANLRRLEGPRPSAARPAANVAPPKPNVHRKRSLWRRLVARFSALR